MSHSPKPQAGSALLLALFIIVVMLALAVGLSRLLVSSSETIVYEVQGSRALQAAQSGLEISLTQVFALNASGGSCAAVTATRSFSTAALSDCTATIQCKTFSGPPQLIQLTSTASCSRGKFTTRRSVQLEVR